ncbi:GrpE, mitochondrial [Microbotryomycetes sp. JL221]|nr:GrpE, mitochondrial [Microbotryomycetes sp. JL221]
MLRATRTLVRPAAVSASTCAIRTTPATVRLRPTSSARWYSSTKDETPASDQATTDSTTSAAQQDTQKLSELEKKLEESSKMIAELKDARLRGLADFENLQKRSTVEKQQAKDFALQAFAKDLISSIDIIELALKSIPSTTLTKSDGYEPNKDLVSLHQGVSLTKKELDKVLKRHGVVAFDPTGEQFDPNKHEALFQAPVPGKEPGSVLECQEIGYMIKDRLLRPAKVGVVLKQE